MLFNMKKYILSLLLFIATYSTLSAQKGEKIEALRVAFITQKLNLDSKTAEKFWPIYNQYADEMKSLRQQRKNNNNDGSAEDYLEDEQKSLDLRKKYAQQFLKVISNEQLSTLYQAEREFKQMILKRMRQKN